MANVCLWGHLYAPLAGPLYAVVVVPGAARTGAGALPQEVEGASVTGSCGTRAAQTHVVITPTLLERTLMQLWIKPLICQKNRENMVRLGLDCSCNDSILNLKTST